MPHGSWCAFPRLQRVPSITATFPVAAHVRGCAEYTKTNDTCLTRLKPKAWATASLFCVHPVSTSIPSRHSQYSPPVILHPGDLKLNPSPITNHPSSNASLMQAIEESSWGKPVVRGRKMLWVEEGRNRLDPRPTIDVLPDIVLLETFELYLGKDHADESDYYYEYDGWQTLVHVCRRWRSIVFASPRRLDLKLYCTRQRSVNSRTLNIWPALPIVIFSRGMKSKEDVTNVIAALRHHNRVCKIYCDGGRQFQEYFLNEFAAIDEPFPSLTSLRLVSYSEDLPVLPDSFLGGSAPRLRSLHFFGIPYPSIGKLLSSTTNLVHLFLWRIPHSGYIAPETIVPCLSTLPTLESLDLGFQHPRSQALRASRHPPPLTRVVFPNLTILSFKGDIEYLEDILSRMEAPILNQTYFHFFNQLVFDTPLLGHFIRCTETFSNAHAARIEISYSDIRIRLLEREEEEMRVTGDNRRALWLVICCKPLDWQFSALTQVLNSSLSSLQTLESLEIAVDGNNWQGEMEVIQWRELLHPFTAVKKLTPKSEDSVRFVAPALQELSRESATEVLPALQNVFLYTEDWRPSGPVKEAIEQFIAARQLDGHPVTVHYYDRKSGENVQ